MAGAPKGATCVLACVMGPCRSLDRGSRGPPCFFGRTMQRSKRGNRWVDDGEVDRINCGPGYDMVVLGRGDRADRSCEVRYSILTRRLTGPRIIRRPRMCHDYVIGPSKPHTVLMGTNRRDCDEAVASPRAVAAFVVFGTGFGRRTSMRGVDVECRTNFVARVVFVGGLDLHNSAGGVGCVGFGMF